MNKKQLTELVIIPTLKKVFKGYTEESLLAVQMIIAHESLRGEYLKQVGGPALGIIGMEPATYHSVWADGDSVWQNAKAAGFITEYEYNRGIYPSDNRLIYDLAFCVFMARQRLFMFREPLPDNAGDMSYYLKKYWNAGGKATATKYHFDFMEWK